MKFRSTLTRRQWIGGLIGAASIVVLGVVCSGSRIGDGLVRRSYDLPFVFRPAIHPDEAAIVYLDDPSHEQLKQPFNAPWDRSLHARLVERLTADGARAVVFDIIFSDPGPDPKADQRLAQAIQANGKVVLAADYTSQELMPDILGSKVTLPTESFRKGAAGIGLATLAADPHNVVRRHFTSTERVSTLAEVAVGIASGNTNPAPKLLSERLWINYYGPPRTIPGYSFSQVLLPDGVASNAFHNKVIFVGAGQTTGYTKEAKDTFTTPYTIRSRGTPEFSSGVEIHATAFLNLLRNESLRRFNPVAEELVLLVCGLIVGFSLTLARPLFAILEAAIIALGVLVLVGLLVWTTHYWFAWLIVMAVQIPAATIFSVAFNFYHNHVEKEVFRKSLESYLPKAQAEELRRHPELLKRAFVKKDLSIMFTDIANFSTIAEPDDPEELAENLNKYFEVTTAAVQEANGTLIKYIGDAIFAIWNAPLERNDHKELACQAALDLHQAVKRLAKEMEGPPFVTRIGLHFGEACVGNFGGKERFDYTAIGHEVNVASRVEGLNKHLGTSILATDPIVTDEAKGKFVFRMVGLIQPKGVGTVKIHELIGPIAEAEATKAWRQAFAEAVQDYYSKNFEEAELGFQRAIALGDKKDGPASYYLKEIEKLRKNPPDSKWIGKISLDEK